MAVPRDSQVHNIFSDINIYLIKYYPQIFYRLTLLSWIQNATIFFKHSSIKPSLISRYVVLDEFTIYIIDNS